MGEYKVRLTGNPNSIIRFVTGVLDRYQTTEKASSWYQDNGFHVFQLHEKEDLENPVDYMHKLASRRRIKLEIISPSGIQRMNRQ